MASRWGLRGPMGSAAVVHLDINEAAFERVRRALRGAPKRIALHRATVGIQEREGGEAKVDYYGRPEEGTTLAGTMRLHEFGAGELPERSWLRAWFDAQLDRLKAGMRAAVKAEFEGNPRAVHEWVRSFTDEWRDWIAAGGDFTGLMPTTIGRKRTAGLPEPETPLVATKQFVNAFRARIDGEDL